MLQLLQPIWLLAMAGIVFPLIIHFWNDRQGRTLPIGSVLFLEKSSRRQARSPRVSEIWLLLLRCLLLVVLALLLAGPSWRKSPAGAAAKGWVVISDSSIAAGEFRPMIDSLVKKGYALRQLSMDSSAGGNWWAGFRSLDREASAAMPFYIFTDGRAIHFRGDRPVSAREVHWKLAGDTAGAAIKRIVAAWPEAKDGGAKDSIVVMTLESRPTGSIYHYGKMPVAMVKDGLVSGVPVDTSVLRIWIGNDGGYERDGRYVAAAVKALREYTRRNIQVYVSGSGWVGGGSPGSDSRGSGDGRAVGGGDWLFWLSDRPLPAQWSGGNALIYQPGKGMPVATTVAGMDVTIGRMQWDSVDRHERSLWRDGFGRPLLTVEQHRRKKIYHFYSHFDPSWNGLVWSARFPALLGELLMSDLEKRRLRPGDDLRVLDPSQVLPGKYGGAAGLAGEEGAVDETADMNRKGREGRGAAAGGVTTRDMAAAGIAALDPPAALRTEGARDLSPLCWLMAFLLFAAERILSYRHTKTGNNG